MARNTKIILLLGGGVLAILVIILIFVSAFSGGGEPIEAVNDDQGGSLPPASHIIINDNVVAPVTKDNTPTLSDNQKQEISLERMARSFAERYGSYSNQSNFENIKDLQIFMTPFMKDWSDKYIEQHLSGTSQIYWGVSTRALAIKLSEIKESEATIIVATQRKETSGNDSNFKTYKQDLKMIFKKLEGLWLVDGAYWQ